MISQPLVTIMINNYNYGRYLADAIDSALQQTYQPIQVIAVDDGSTDGSRDVLGRYGDRITAVLRSNGGQAAAINAGMQEVRGDVVFLLDADDTLLPDVAARVVAAMRAQPDCVRVQFRLRVRHGDQAPGDDTVPPAEWPLRTGDVRRDLFRYGMFRSPPTSGNAWRTSALRALPPVPQRTFSQYADRYYSDLTPLLGTITALEAPGGTYRIHHSNHHLDGGRGLEYFTTHIALTRSLHEIGREVARENGVRGYPATVDTPLDAAYLCWRVIAGKLGAPQEPGSRRVGLRAAYAALLQPGHPVRSRIARAAWVLVVLVTPPRSRALTWLISARYDRGNH